MQDLEEKVEKAAEDEDYDLAEDLQSELELYQAQEGPKAALAKTQIEKIKSTE